MNHVVGARIDNVRLIRGLVFGLNTSLKEGKLREKPRLLRWPRRSSEKKKGRLRLRLRLRLGLRRKSPRPLGKYVQLPLRGMFTIMVFRKQNT